MCCELVDLFVEGVFDADELFLGVLVLVDFLAFLVLDDREPDFVLFLFLLELEVGFIGYLFDFLFDTEFGLGEEFLLLGAEIGLQGDVVEFELGVVLGTFLLCFQDFSLEFRLSVLLLFLHSLLPFLRDLLPFLSVLSRPDIEPCHPITVIPLSLFLHLLHLCIVSFEKLYSLHFSSGSLEGDVLLDFLELEFGVGEGGF